MALHEELERSGAWLFRYRSWAPPLLLVPLVLAGTVERPGERPGLEPLPLGIGLAVAALGFVVRALVIGHAPAGTSGKNRDEHVAERLTTTGLYSLVRHPLYLGNYLLWLGPAFASGIWWTVALVTAAWLLFYERIGYTEEEFLRRTFGEQYRGWADETPAFLPRWRRWQPATLTFSIKTVLRQEYYAWFSTVAMFVALQAGTVLIETRRVALGSWWLLGLGAAAAICGTLRVLQRYTKVLDVPGR